MAGDQAIGYVCVLIAVLCFGSNFVPVKKFETGDGFFFQWVLCAAIWIAGLVTNLIITDYSEGITSSIQFYPFAMLGGIIWCIGNSMVVTIIKCVGLSLGMCLWGSVNLIMGWASGTFGFFGIIPQHVKFPLLNYLGAGIALCGVVLFLFIKPSEDEQPRHSYHHSDEGKFLLNDPYRVNSEPSINTPIQDGSSWIDRLTPVKKRLIGILLSVISGCCYGLNFDPPQLILDRTKESGLHMVFSHFSGIFLMSTVILIAYAAVKKNSPVVYPQAILPGVLSGLLWSFAQISWFIANGKLSLVVTFPLLATGPALLATMWGVLLFKEIRGARNFAFLGAAFAVIIGSAVLIALSNILHDDQHEHAKVH